MTIKETVLPEVLVNMEEIPHTSTWLGIPRAGIELEAIAHTDGKSFSIVGTSLFHHLTIFGTLEQLRSLQSQLGHCLDSVDPDHQKWIEEESRKESVTDPRKDKCHVCGNDLGNHKQGCELSK